MLWHETFALTNFTRQNVCSFPLSRTGEFFNSGRHKVSATGCKYILTQANNDEGSNCMTSLFFLLMETDNFSEHRQDFSLGSMPPALLATLLRLLEYMRSIATHVLHSYSHKMLLLERVSYLFWLLSIHLYLFFQ